eukprot:jgi/Orpsp1_1/1175839/evm.model.c7180000055406.1
MHYKNPYSNEWKVKGRPGFLEVFACILKSDERIDDYDFFQKLFINFAFPYVLSNEAIQSLLNILEGSNNTEIVKIVINLFQQYVLFNENNKKKIFSKGLIDVCIFRLLNKDTDSHFVELFDLIKVANIPNDLTKLQCLIFSRIFETCFDIYKNDSRVVLEDLTKTPIIKYLLHQILNKNFDVTKASYQLLLRLSNNDTLINDFLKEWGSMHVSSIMKNKNVELLYPVALLVKKLLMK